MMPSFKNMNGHPLELCSIFKNQANVATENTLLGSKNQ